MSTHIHASAVIDPRARLGSGVRVGPGVIIEEGCEIGDHCEIRAHAVICQGTVMGAQNQIGYGAVIGAEPQDYAYKGGPVAGRDRHGQPHPRVCDDPPRDEGGRGRRGWVTIIF